MSEKIPVSKVLVENSSGKFLSVREKKSGKWELPGGKIEDKEDRFQASRRELKEEVNLEISSVEDVVRVEVEDEKCVNCWIMHTSEFSGDVELDRSELSDFRWVSGSEYLELDWHADAGYAIPAIRFLNQYLD